MTQPTIGIDPTRVTAAAEFKLGTLGVVNHPTKGDQVFVYGQARGAVTAAGYVCVAQTNFDFAHITTTETAAGTSGHGSQVGVAQAAMADNAYGWFQVAGKGSVRTAALAAKGTRLNTTATAGVVDDDGTVGARAINGMVLGTATGGAEATNADAYMSYPSVGTTL